jgi:hypothetical protein
VSATTPTEAPAPVIRVSRRGRIAGVGLVAGLAVLFLAGTVVGDDPWWPFGPWRMFSTSTAPSGAVVWLTIEARSPQGGWRPADLTPTSVGLNRAEVEGRMGQMAADPGMLATLARSHARLRPHDAAWTGVRVVRVAAELADGRPTGDRRRDVVVSWEQP